MDPLLTIWGLCLLSPVIMWGGDKVMQARRSRRPTRAARPGDSAQRVPGLPRERPSLERLVADLHRLEREYRRVECSEPPAKAQRLRAISLAYDDVLCECCLALGLPPPPQRPLSGVDRIQAECELARHGLTW
ncbi:hypothetical protein [Ornithinimicrobium sediminis]|uniref:hypothetical protein n=1 Tax=Ornithinimicrobium sediminis TaxID=2904603 RepID=UPI001E44FB57|nr:hypothetical protein [Ornithinimicrobium sediminis]MCE0485282.1 hypothetical protein [Ornithinimicrobium sediminis]